MINKLTQAVFLLCAFGAIGLAVHLFRYDVIMEDPANGAFAVFDRLTGEARVCEINPYDYDFTCDGEWLSVTR